MWVVTAVVCWAAGNQYEAIVWMWRRRHFSSKWASNDTSLVTRDTLTFFFFLLVLFRSHWRSRSDNADCSRVLCVGRDVEGDVKRFPSFAIFAGVTFTLCLHNWKAILQSRQSDDSPDSPSWGPVRSTWSDRWLSVGALALFLLRLLFFFLIIISSSRSR